MYSNHDCITQYIAHSTSFYLASTCLISLQEKKSDIAKNITDYIHLFFKEQYLDKHV